MLIYFQKIKNLDYKKDRVKLIIKTIKNYFNPT